jgi:ERCC4-related helicase
VSKVAYSPLQGHYLSHQITLANVDEDAFTRSLTSARVEMNPHQVNASLFALKSPLSKGVLLADEVGLGKTIEAGLVIAQRWAERRRKILLIVPASLRKQWEQELWSKFTLKSTILEGLTYKAMVKAGNVQPFQDAEGIVICSYEFAAGKSDELALIGWDLVIFDEAHRLRNVYKKSGSERAKKLRQALKEPFKILLTATPLQNSLMELYGLSTLIDDTHFGGEAAFRSLYSGARGNAASMEVLRDRLEPICHRTLRKQVVKAGLINFTERHAQTFSFEPSDKETELYDKVSDFLKRKDTFSYGDRANQLVVLQVRKILGSSTFAVTGYLRKLIERLELQKLVDKTVTDDIENIDELSEEMFGAEDDAHEISDLKADPVELQSEITELKGYLELAQSIGDNGKGEALLRQLPTVLDQIVEKNGQRKAVIFTESVRTQTYLNKLLTDNGYDGQTVLLNGSNNDPASREMFKEWKEEHAGTDKISGSRTADMKAAVVDAFKSDEKTILISTESGAEGINLQFCSLVVNFDLPWNPQRVEQRIGRCHRYGQKVDVTVVNMLNLKNATEARIYELLYEKFKLFEGVFGSSDEVLGSIEQGVDFEKRVLDIVQNSRSGEEIEEQFDILQGELQDSIEADIEDARSKVLEHMDEAVVSKLKDRGGKLEDMLGAFERRLTLIARAELPEANFHSDDGPRFDLNGLTYTTKWPDADDNDWQFFRLIDDNLANDVVEKAKSRNYGADELTLVFHPDNYPFMGQLGDVQELKGKSGWLLVAKASIQTAQAPREDLLLSCIDDSGEKIDPKTADKMFLTPAKTISGYEGSAPKTDLAEVMKGLFSDFTAHVNNQNALWLDEEEDRLDNYAKDIEIELDAQIEEMETEVKELRRDGRKPGLSMDEKLEISRDRKKLERDIDKLKLSKHDRRQEIRDKVGDMLDELADSLNKTPQLEHLFTIRWQVE